MVKSYHSTEICCHLRCPEISEIRNLHVNEKTAAMLYNLVLTVLFFTVSPVSLIPIHHATRDESSG